MRAISRQLRAFGLFWWDFLVGEAPALFVGALVAIGLALALRHHRVADIVVLPIVAVGFLAVSTYRGRQRA
jgi:hypothetical protein